MKKILILTILIVFIIGGSYAVYLGNDLVNDDSKDISSNTKSPINNTTINNQKTDINSDIIENPNSGNNKIVKLYRNIPGTMVKVNTSVDYTDLYAQCVVCGGFVPLGEVTKPLPEDAICPDLCGGSSTVNGYEYVSSYYEAYTFWLEYGRHPEQHSPVDTKPTTTEPINQPDNPVDTDYEPSEIVIDTTPNVYY